MIILKAAIVGCGAIYTNHAEALTNNDNIELVCVCDINEEKAAKAADKYKCKYYTDYNQMLKTEKLDVVHICTPHYLHASMSIAAMRSGNHGLTEKPMAISISDAKAMIEVSKETGKRLGVCFQNRFNATSVRIKEAIESGEVGKVIRAKGFVTWHREAPYYTDSGWRGSWKTEGGWVLINQSIHTLDLLQWFLGDIHYIKGSVDTRLLQDVIEVEDTAEATIKFSNGASAIFYATNCYSTDSPVELEIICEKAVLRLTEDLTIKYKNGETEYTTDADNKAIG
ncbi:Gfo/Idh/MocA family protein [Clostridium lacusfryxellense]|uniref:Gfo/Idh/MocA family protein n=1 Tax=Clostridium lacusfryxellense TaxID=205328 RepID=UPI001FE946F8|nr:Gfo/Idh/MocA family oxidoreductase [Clostridium lacusfryxellense]